MTNIAQIKKRDASTVNFDANKIKHAIEKAFIDVRRVTDEEKVAHLIKEVLLDLEFLFANRIPNVENVQDVVEKQLMQEGYYDVAKSYILYRYEHEKRRKAKGVPTFLDASQPVVVEKHNVEQLILVKPTNKNEKNSSDKSELTGSGAGLNISSALTSAFPAANLT